MQKLKIYKIIIKITIKLYKYRNNRWGDYDAC